MATYNVTPGTRFKMHAKYVGRVVSMQLGLVPEGEEARQEFQGPLVPGPWAYAFPLATIISAHTLVDPNPVIADEVKEGDVFVIEGNSFVFRDDNMMEYPNLYAV